jgi:hypothetical protein
MSSGKKTKPIKIKVQGVKRPIAKKPRKKNPLSPLAKSFEKIRASFVPNEKCKAKITALIGNKRNKFISLVGKRAFRVGEKGHTAVFTGITHKLHDVFYPDTEEDPYKRSKEDIKRRKPLKHYQPQGTFKRKCKTFGSKHGTKVHQQIQTFVKQFVKGKKITFRRSLDACTIRILKLLLTKGWIPVASELMVYDEELKIATAIDLIVLEVTTQKMFFIELKTGYENEEYGIHPTDKGMSKPLNKIANCPQNRHQLQLLMTLLIVQRGHKFKPDGAFILRSCSKQEMAVLIGMAQWTTDPSIHKSILNALER